MIAKFNRNVMCVRKKKKGKKDNNDNSRYSDGNWWNFSETVNFVITFGEEMYSCVCVCVLFPR